MEQLKKNKFKILLILIAIIIVVGIIIVVTKGFNFELQYQDSQMIQLYLKKEFDVKDIRQITDEALKGKEVNIQKVEVYEDMVAITAKEINEEEKNNIVEKVNEKYGTEISADTTEIVQIPHTRGRDLVKPYIIPFVLATVIILVYMAIRYRKLGTVKVVFKTGFILVLLQLVLASIFAIIRFPIGKFTIPIALVVYLLTLMGISNLFENKLKNLIETDSDNI